MKTGKNMNFHAIDNKKRKSSIPPPPKQQQQQHTQQQHTINNNPTTPSKEWIHRTYFCEAANKQRYIC